MASADTRQRTTWGTRLQLLVRVIGLTGVLAAVAGASMFDTVVRAGDWSLDVIRTAADGAQGAFAQIAAWLLAAGAAAIVFALAIEFLGGLLMVAGRRTAANTTATLSIAAALALIVFVNAYSFTHHSRFDLTRDKRYTLPPELVERFQNLRTAAPTTILVLQMHKTFGVVTDARDDYTAEADRVVTEKVKDLVDQFREFGPRFNVVVIDTEASKDRLALDSLTKNAPELKAAIEGCPENSIFFHVPGHVQRLAFNEFLQLDKTASKEAQGGRGNLVLLPQGVASFAQRVLAVQERRPKVALCVIHELLTSGYPEGSGEMFTHAGLKKTLESHGFEVVDIVLKRWEGASSVADLKPAADTREEAKVERLEGELASARLLLSAVNRTIRTLELAQAEIDKVKDSPWPKREALYRQLFRGAAVAEEQEAELLAAVTRQAAKTKASLDEAKKKVAAAEAAMHEAMADERTLDSHRIDDAKAKLKHMLADVDLMIIPRFTMDDAAARDGPIVPAEYHGLRDEQVKVIRDFMAAGKPVLACLGPISSPVGEPESADGFERLLSERGIGLGTETVLFDVEQKAFAARMSGDQFGGAVSADIPSLGLVELPQTGPGLLPNPIAAAFRLTARGAGQALEVRKKALRPVYLAPGWQADMPFASEFFVTGPDCWNEEKPFLKSDRRRTADGRTVRVLSYIPEYEPTTPTDPKWGTPRAVRKGPFSVGVAIESKVPAAWVNEQYQEQEFVAAMLSSALPADPVMASALTIAARQLDRKTERLVVFGSGNLFSGPQLKPAEQELLLHSVNWLTGRADRLPRNDLEMWSYPRVSMSARDLTLWQLGTAVGLPALAIYLGLVAMMLRRLR